MLGILLSASPILAHATVWHVEHDPNHPEDRIGQVVLQAGDGDTIRVGPGTYYEHIPLPASGLVIESTHGREATIIDGSREFSGRAGSVLYFEAAAGPDLTLQGFTIQGGTGTLFPEPRLLGGGAIAIRVFPGTGRVHVEACRFAGNHVPDQGLQHYGGGAVLLDGNLESRFVGCEFVANSIGGDGEHVYLEDGIHVIEDSTFELDTDDYAGMALYLDPGSMSLTNCTFRARGTCSPDLYSIVAYSGQNVSIQSCIFQDQGGACARRVKVLRLNDAPGHYRLVDCVFSGPPSGGIVYIGGAGSGTVEFLRNTVVGCYVYGSTQFDGSVMLHNNIFHHCEVGVSSRDCEISCNNAWPGTIDTRYCGVLTSNDNLSADPQFCEESLGDYRLARTSPCTEENAPDGCGQIGALGIGCNGMATTATTWGKLRFLFR